MRWWRQHQDREREWERELQNHLELEAAEQQENGLAPEEACYAAKRALGNTTLIQEEVRETWAWAALDRFRRDFIYASRTLRRNWFLQ